LLVYIHITKYHLVPGFEGSSGKA
jgi:hypothetical protein